ncbi:MAG: hypothetical protein E7440_01430 [Ruminococcaceae bacterium]|nr:hypothetical protein [Oscillospiraceae bacterium]
MKSGTSFFNCTLFKKNLTRYWPIWALYALVWIYAMPVRCITIVSRNQAWMGETPIKQVQAFANGIPDLLEGLGVFMAFTSGVLAAMAVFSYLYNNRAAGMVHSLPVSREGLFLTNYLSGLVCLIGPNVLVWLLTLGAESLCSGYMDLYTVSVWFAAQSAMCIFFYSFAVFCAMFTGHLLALPAFYGILNFLAAFLMLLFDVLFEPFLYGYAGMTSTAEETVLWLTPFVHMIEELRWTNPGTGYRLLGVAELVIYTAVGLVFAALALLVYRKRHIESAGDVVAVAVVRPVFKYGVALCSGLSFGYWLHAMFGFEAPFGLMGSLLLWTFIGYFAAEMLLKKSFRVWKAWRGCAVLLVLVAVGLGALRGDAFGFVTRVPAANKVESVVVDGMGSYPYDVGRSFEFETQDAALIEKVIALHRGIVAQHKNPDSGEGGASDYIRLHVTYVLSNGTTLRRDYGTTVWPGSKLEQVARDFYCDAQVAQMSYGMDDIDPTRLTNVEIGSLWNTKEKKNEYYDLTENIPVEERQTALLAIYDALMADFKQGKLGKRYLFDLEEERQLNTCTTDLTIYWNEPYRVEATGVDSSITRIERVEAATSYYNATHGKSITLTPNAENTIRVLTELGILDEDTTLRLYREIVDEEERAKLIYGSMGHDPEELTSINLDPNSAYGIIGGADGPTAIIRGGNGDISASEAVPYPVG